MTEEQIALKKAKRKAYYEAHKEEAAAQAKAYAAKNRQKLTDKHREYCAANREKINAYYRNYRVNNAEKVHKLEFESKARNPLKRWARKTMERAIITGFLTRPLACEQCHRDAPVEGHHEDYNRPLDVNWLCVPCHATADRNRRKREATEKSLFEQKLP